MKLSEIIDKNKVKTISEKLDIPETTLRRWIRHENISNHTKFIELLLYLDVDIEEFIKKYPNNKN